MRDGWNFCPKKKEVTGHLHFLVTSTVLTHKALFTKLMYNFMQSSLSSSFLFLWFCFILFCSLWYLLTFWLVHELECHDDGECFVFNLVSNTTMLLQQSFKLCVMCLNNEEEDLCLCYYIHKAE